MTMLDARPDDPCLNLVGHGPAMTSLREDIQVARHAKSVLITGENGTGKELVARAVAWTGSPQPFVAVNCSAIPQTLIEAELFGYSKGAFTGAFQERPGKFQAAHGGTIFLDEIGDLPLAMQGPLLRVLQERVVVKVGSLKEERIDVRVVAATNKDLLAEIKKGAFREDLFQRLSAFELATVPLRDHLDDLRAIAQTFAPELPFVEADWALLESYPWPGNVRELENVLSRTKLHMSAGHLCSAALAKAMPKTRSLPENETSPAVVRDVHVQSIGPVMTEKVDRLLAELHVLRARVSALEERIQDA